MTWRVVLQLDEQVYSCGVIQRAVYSVARDFVAEIQKHEQRTILLITPNPLSANAATLSEDQAEALLLQQLNDFALRERIRQETAGIRESLIRAALIGYSSE